MFKHWTVSCRLESKVMEGSGAGNKMSKYHGLDMSAGAHAGGSIHAMGTREDGRTAER